MNRPANNLVKAVILNYKNTLPHDYSYHPLNHVDIIQPIHPQLHKSLSKTNNKFAIYTKCLRMLIMGKLKCVTFEQFLTLLNA